MQCEGSRTREEATTCHRKARYRATRDGYNDQGIYVTLVFYTCRDHANRWETLNYDLEEIDETERDV